MRILHLNKFAHVVGGSEKYMISLANLQRKIGHEVAVCGMASKNYRGPDDLRVFGLPEVDYREIPLRERAKAGLEVVWSRERAKQVRAVVQQFSPDVVHLHLYSHQLTSSVVAEIQKLGIPIVHTAHDYKLSCPAYLASVDGQDCNRCSHSISPQLLLRRCLHKKLSWSAVAATEAAFVRSRSVCPSTIIAPSEYMANALYDSWVRPLANIRLVRNPAEPAKTEWTGGEDYILYVGRLSREKGIVDLISAANELGVPLKIAGDGPERSLLEQTAYQTGASVQFLGWCDDETLSQLRTNCRAQVVPSAWPENAPLAAIEAAVAGTPLVAANRGGLPEYAKLGAWMSLIDQTNAPALKHALRELDDITPNIEYLRAQLSWTAHTEVISDIYTVTQNGG